MSVHMSFAFLFKKTLLKMSLSVVRSALGVLTSTGKLIIFTPTVSWVKYVSDFCGHILATTIP